jgi:hypothetical protein
MVSVRLGRRLTAESARLAWQTHDSEMAPQSVEKIEFGLENGPANASESAGPYSFTHLPLAFDDLTAASTNSRPLTPSSMVGKCADLSGFFPTRAALMANATSE